MWQIYSWKHLLKISIQSSQKQWVYGNWRSIGGQFKVGFKVVFFLEYGFLCLYGWPSSGYGSTLSLLTRHAGFQGGYYGNHSLFVCFLAPRSTARGGSVAYMVYLPGVWLQLGWCIIALRWWSFQTQLEMPAGCACMRTRHTPNTAYIRSWMYLYIRIQASSNQYISNVHDVTGLIHGHGCTGWCLLYISRVFFLLSSLYHRIHAHGSPQLPYRNI